VPRRRCRRRLVQQQQRGACEREAKCRAERHRREARRNLDERGHAREPAQHDNHAEQRHAAREQPAKKNLADA